MEDEFESYRPTLIASLALLQQRGFAAQTFIDVGAAEGGFFLLRRQMDLFQGARHFFVDAMQENEDIYRRLGERFGSGHEIAALSSAEGTANLRIDPDFYNTHIEHLQSETGYVATRQVPMTTLDSLVKRHALKPPFAVKLDVQGGELDALRGGVQTLEQAVVVVAEVQIFPLRDGIVELLGFMQGCGWALYDLTDPAYYLSDDTFYQCYATFIPTRLDFRRQSSWCLPEQQEGAFEKLRARRAGHLEAIEELLAYK